MPNDMVPTIRDHIAATPSFTATRICIVALLWMPPVPMLAAGFTCSQQPGSARMDAPEELNEVVITASQAVTRPRDLQAWLARLVGRYTYEGHVDLCGNGHEADRRPVTGAAACARIGSMPNVHCTIRARWPEAHTEDGTPVPSGRSNLDPALLSFSLEKRARPGPEVKVSVATFEAAIRSGVAIGQPNNEYWGLAFTQLDNSGVMEWGSGELIADTFTAREACIGMEGTCQKTTRVTAKPGSDEVTMIVDVTIDSRRVMRQAFMLRREPASAAGNGSVGATSP